ncbi:DUF6493 family protein [Streptomyces sp. NPDC056061]|uniref:DUF7825 domain-containing protein n=1 Tax=Streptomyces sp. NPDC056061 TaxID=3345700 RepID=UPI0035E3BCEA
MKELLTAVRNGRAHEVPALLEPLDPAERRAALTELKALRKEVRDWQWQEQQKAHRALLVAGAGCHTGAASCASWLGSRDLQGWGRPSHGLVVQALKDRDPAWLADVAHRLAARPTTAEITYELIAGLVRLAQCPVPTTEGFTRGWADSVSRAPWRQRRTRPLTDILRTDPFLPVLLPLLFELPELPSSVVWYADDENNPCQWPVALAVLVDEGLLERSALIDHAVSRLLRGGKPGDLRFCLEVLRRLALTEQEESERFADWIGMAADGTSTVAGHAQQVLGRLDERGELPVRVLADVSRSMLFRTEKKLVRSQLVLLGKVLRRDRSASGELLPAAADAFGHEDVGLQERALKLVTRHLPAVDDATREELALAAEHLSPVHRAAAVAAFGDLPDDRSTAEPYEEILPPPPALRPLGPAPATQAELVEEVVVLVKGSRSAFAAFDTVAFERTLDGLVRHAHADRSGLSDALREALAGQWWLTDDHTSHARRWLTSDARIELVVAVLLGRVSKDAVKAGRASWAADGSCVHAALDGVYRARIWEAADAVLNGSVPFLLAVPTWHTGSLDPAELVDRLRAYQRLGLTPGETDFGQALLRVRRDGEHPAAADAAALGTPEGDRLAAWMRADEPLVRTHHFDLRRETHTAGGAVSTPVSWTGRALMATEEHPFIQQEFPRAFHWLGRPHSPGPGLCYHWGDQPESWLSTLPQDAEALAAWLLPILSIGATDEIRGTARPLPPLAELDAPAGEAVHLSVAYGLGSRHPEDRLCAVDALLILAARGQLDTALLGKELASLLEQGLVKPNRLADAMRTAATTGAYRTALSVLAVVLPCLLAQPKAPRGLSDLLAVAAECAEQCGAVGAEQISGLAETAARGGSSQLVRQAVRLKTTWEQRAARA